MAYVRKRGKTWSFTVDIGIDPATGKRRQKTKGGFRTKKEAELAAAAIEQAVAKNMYFEESNMTFSEFANDWLKEYRLSVKLTTAELRKRNIDILNQYFGALRINKITRKQYQDALNSLSAIYKPSTVSILHTTAQMIFRKALEYNLIHDNPTQFAKIIRKQLTVEELEAGTIPKYLEKEELAQFLQAVKLHHNPQDYTLFYLLAYTGMRIGEVMALKWSDISFSEKTISITKTCYLPRHNSEKYVLLPPKTTASIREISIDDSVVSELKKHKFYQNSLIQSLNQKTEIYKDQGFVFTSYRNPGYPYNKATIHLKMKQALEQAGIKKNLSAHSLRHTHTSLLAEAGVSLIEIMDRLGHQDDSITRRIYLHVTKSKKIEASEKFAKLMSNVVKM